MINYIVLGLCLASCGIVIGLVAAMVKHDWNLPRTNRIALTLYVIVISVILSGSLWALYQWIPRVTR